MKTLLTISILFLTINVWAKPIGYNVSDLIGSARFVDEVIITGYDSLDNAIKFQSLKFKDTLNDASCAICKGYNYSNPESDQWTNNMPFVGDTVLIIVNGYGTAVVFGKKVDGYYRLWSTVFSGSIAIFEFKSPILPLNKEEVLNSNGNMTSCWDGCLVPISQLSQLIENYRQEFSKKLEVVELSKLENTEVYNIFYDESLKHINGFLWLDEPPGKLRSMILTYSNGKSLQVTPYTEGNQPAQFDVKREFNLEEFQKMKIKKIEWIN
jgi:hypothetical protein